jgi:hypothetical protein
MSEEVREGTGTPQCCIASSDSNPWSPRGSHSKPNSTRLRKTNFQSARPRQGRTRWTWVSGPFVQPTTSTALSQLEHDNGKQHVFSLLAIARVACA